MTTSVLHKPCLLLNKSWQAVSVRNVVKCLTKVINGKAKIVDPYSYQIYDWEDWMCMEPEEDELCIRAIDLKIKVPEVIVLTHYNKIPKIGVTFNRRNIYTRDNYSCQYCGVQLDRPDITIDHVIPRSAGGKSTFENCVVSCFPCNSRKANKPLHSSGLKLLRKPIKPRWVPSFHSGEILSSWENFLSDVYWNTAIKD